MICIVLLSGLNVFSISVSLEKVDMNTLHKIIRFFEKNYKPSTQTSSGDGSQYAVAINVPQEQCGNAFREENFLSGDNAEEVKSKLSDIKLYEGERLVAATPNGTNKRKKIHSDHALLMLQGSHAATPVQNLLKKDKNGCVVFYTYNSPCLEYCLNQARDDDIQKQVDKQKEKKTSEGTPENKCILKSLSMLTNHKGPKAFVFSKVYTSDQNKKNNLAFALKKVAEQVPLYKCDIRSCVKCLDNNQNLDNQCLS